jgi:IS1 family transposase
MWSFVGCKENKQWIWLAMDADTREIVGVFIGDHSRQSAKQLWQCLPAIYRQCAICYTDFWESYTQVLPSKRPRAVGKETGKTSYIELADTLLLFEKQERTRRFNNTLRQRIGRFVRKALSFSKKLSNHIGAVWYFVHHYNASLRS